MTDEAEGDDDLRRALLLMQEALRLIDENDGPSEAGAHLDTAIISIRNSIFDEKSASPR